METLPVVNNVEKQRFEAHVSGEVAVLIYEQDGEHITLVETLVPPSLEGRGIGSSLARAGLDYARQHGMSVTPQCPFVRRYLEKHPEYQDLVQGKQ